MTDTPFDAGDNPVSTKIDPEKDYHEDLVGDDKRYKDDKALARSKVEGDNHITNLESELRGLRKELKDRTDMETLVTELKTVSTDQREQAQQIIEEPNNSEQQNSSEQSSNEQNPEKIEQLVNSLVEKREQENRRKRNLDEVTQKLASNWGSNAEENWIALRNELDMSEEEMRSFASTKPAAFLKMADVAEGTKEKTLQPQPSLFSRGDVESTQFSPKSSVKNWNYYEQIRKQDPNKYHSVSFQSEIHKEAQAQGEEFYTS